MTSSPPITAHLGQGRHAPVEGLGRARVPPAAAVAVEAARAAHHGRRARQRRALAVVECDVVDGDVSAGARRAPDPLHDHLEAGVGGDLHQWEAVTGVT